MKFTKEEARAKITDAFSNKVKDITEWERTIRENVDTLCSLLGEDSEIELDEFTAKAVALLDTQSGHLNKSNSLVAKSLNDKIKELEEAAKKAGSKNEDGDEDKGGKKDNVYDELLERFKKLEERFEKEEKQKSVQQKVSEIKEAVKKKGVKNDEWIDTMLSKFAVTEETDIEKEADSFVEIYNKFNSDTPIEVTPGGAGGGGSRMDSIKAEIDRIGKSIRPYSTEPDKKKQ
jgi:hypothetical protein